MRALSIFILSFLLGSISVNKSKRAFYVSILLVLFIFSSTTCEKEPEKEVSDDVREFSFEIENLTPNREYYWKIIAYPNEYERYRTESLLNTFKTKG